MSAYYNEIDPFAAEWLRELIKAGHIAPGEVDERSICDVEPKDLSGFTQAHFFAGIGVWSYALRASGWSDDTPVWTGSCPCQSFSASGKRGGFSDHRHLWPTWFRLIRQLRPHVVFGEQVATKDGLAWIDVVSADLEGEAYSVGAVDTCAAGFGAPHVRQRLYWVADSQTSDGWRTAITADCRRRVEETGRSGVGGWMADSAGRGAERSGAQRDERDIQDGYWSDYEWISTSDGRKFPIKPGLPVLVARTPNRMGRLRGYGNALCAEQAKGFVEAYMEVAATRIQAAEEGR